MKRKFYILTVLFTIVVSNFLFAQQDNSPLYYHSGARLNSRPVSSEENSLNSAGQSGTGANIDVVYHRIWWRINPDSSKGIKGVVTTYFKTIVANVSTITMDLRQSSFNNANLSVTYHGTPCTSSINASNVLSITLPSTIVASGTLDSLTVNYKGIPPAVSGPAQGYQNDTDPTTGQTVTYTLSESYEDRDWWPCKADMQDKIDSIDIIVNVPWSGPDTFWVATNGRLVDSTISGTNRIFTFKSRYPIASYLVTVSVARYNRYYTSVNVGGVNTQVAYYLHRGKSAGNYTTIINAMNLQNQVLQAFSAKYGDYPYKYEKHGYYDGLKGAGGMEHQTFSAIDGGTTSGGIGALADAATLAHELMHQWFGDKATFATWADIYLAEGFARYGEVLAGELVPATGINTVSKMSSIKTAARSITSASTKLTSYSTSAQVWSGTNSTAMYERGCMVVSMLRKLSGDNIFFQACRNYLDSLNGSGYKSATSDSLKNNLSRQMGGYNLTPFFNDWVTGKGHPTTVVNWNKQAANNYRLNISIGSQTRSAGSTVSYFHNVIILRVQGALPANDTMIVIYDIDGNNLAKAGNGIGASIPGNLLSYDLSFIPTTVTFDPYNQTMSNGSTVVLAALATDLTSFTAQKAANGNDIKLTINSTDPISRVLLERSSDGLNFSAAGDMQQTSSNSTELKFQFTDMTPYLPVTFYRAKIYVANGTGAVKYSSIAKVQQSADAGVTIIPNPVSNSLNVTFTNSRAEKVTVRVLNSEGKLVTESSTNNNYIHFDTQKLPAGTYLLQLNKQGQAMATQKFVVRH